MEKKFDVIVVGELNVDLILNHLESFPEIGKEKFAEKMAFTLGSSAAIFASNLSALGKKVSFIGKIGNDLFGRFCKEQLEVKGVDTSMLNVNDDLNTGATVILNYGEDRANVTYQGAMKDLALADITKEMIAASRHLHFSSYFFLPGLKKDLPLLFKMAKDSGLSTSFDIQWDPLELWDIDLKTILPNVDIFLPNEKELLHATQKNNIEEAIESISDYANVIVVKRGSNGSLLKYKNVRLAGNPFLNKNVIDCIGAGDSFNAGFIFKFLQDDTPENCQVFANLMGAISTTQAGGTEAFTNYKGILKIAKEKFGYTG